MPIGYLYVTESEVDGMFYVGQSSRMDDHSVATYLEFYHAGLDHYFYTGDAGEIAGCGAGFAPESAHDFGGVRPAHRFTLWCRSRRL